MINLIADISNANENWVYQSNKLIGAKYAFSVIEHKLVRLLASMVKKDDEDFKEYKFRALELSKILGIDSTNIYRQIDKITDNLMATVLSVKNDDSKEFYKKHLIKNAKFTNGILTLKIDDDMKEFYLKLKQYTRYQLWNVMKFKNKYSFGIYELSKQYEKIGYRTISIEELKFTLDIPKDKYPRYSNFKQKVIDKSVEEVNKYTDLKIKCDGVKEGRKVTYVKFDIKSNSKNEIAVTKAIEQPKENYIEVQNIVKSPQITLIEAQRIYDSAKGNLNQIHKVYNHFKDKKLDNFVGMMISMVKPGAFQEPKPSNLTDNFNNYNQRQYDFSDLEKKLLGWQDKN